MPRSAHRVLIAAGFIAKAAAAQLPQFGSTIAQVESPTKLATGGYAGAVGGRAGIVAIHPDLQAPVRIAPDGRIGEPLPLPAGGPPTLRVKRLERFRDGLVAFDRYHAKLVFYRDAGARGWTVDRMVAIPQGVEDMCATRNHLVIMTPDSAGQAIVLDSLDRIERAIPIPLVADVHHPRARFAASLMDTHLVCAGNDELFVLLRENSAQMEGWRLDGTRAWTSSLTGFRPSEAGLDPLGRFARKMPPGGVDEIITTLTLGDGRLLVQTRHRGVKPDDPIGAPQTWIVRARDGAVNGPSGALPHLLGINERQVFWIGAETASAMTISSLTQRGGSER